jgi:hypothetical protein
MESKIDTPIVLRGRKFTASDLDVIKSCAKIFYKYGRTRISKEICIELEWQQPNGWLKDRACRDVLRELETLGIVKLPKSKLQRKTKNGEKGARAEPNFGNYIVGANISEIPRDIDLVLAKSNMEEQIWNYLIEKHHYLGHSVAVGRCLKYLIVSQRKILGAIAYSSPAWRLGPRDQLLKKLGFSSDEVMNKVINNSRFLILPTVKVENLASKVLSLSIKKVVRDWTWYYSIEPLVAETFVQPSKFYGTCYKASNWLEVGITKGYAKHGMSYHNSQEPKKIYLYGLNRQTRSKLSKAIISEREMA